MFAHCATLWLLERILLISVFTGQPTNDESTGAYFKLTTNDGYKSEYFKLHMV